MTGAEMFVAGFVVALAWCVTVAVAYRWGQEDGRMNR